MIKLEIEDYCQDCPYFDEVSINRIYADNGLLATCIRCGHRDICSRIHDYLLDKLLKEKSDVKEEN
jgi:hypothetical protein